MAARSLAKYAGAALCAILATSCASTGQKGDILGDKDLDYKDAVGVFANPESDPNSLDPIASAAFWGTRYDTEPNNPEAAVRYSGALRKIGSNDEAVTVMTKAVKRHPDNANVNLEMGKALVEDGRAFEAVRYIETALTEKSNDWRALSAYGVALDQMGEHVEARKKYDEALRLQPGAASVISNKGLSYALSGDLSEAVETLRAATANRRADARIRQNLALVLAIKGDYTEAVRLARSDLPPQLADQNAAYFKAMLTGPAYWQDFAADDVSVPTFDAAPAPAPAAPSGAPLPTLKEQPKPATKDSGKPVAEAVVPQAPTPLTNASETREDPQGANAPELKKN